MSLGGLSPHLQFLALCLPFSVAADSPRARGKPQNCCTGENVTILSLNIVIAEPQGSPCPPILLLSQETDHPSLPGPALAGSGQQA